MEQEKLNKIRAERLRKCIDNSGKKDKAIAAEAGYTPQHISNLVRGKKNLTIDTARILSRILGVRIEYLLYEDNYMTEIDKISSEISNLKDVSINICNVLDNKGYCLLNDDYTKTCGTFKTISFTHPYETEDKTDNEILESIKEKIMFAKEENMLSLKHPDGRIVRITSTQFNQIIENIENYIDYQMHLVFSSPKNYLHSVDMIPKNKAPGTE